MERLSLPVTGKKFLRIRAQKLSDKQSIKMVSLLCQYARQIKPPFGFFSKNAKKSAKITLLNAAVFNLSKKRV